MRVSDIMTIKIESVSPITSLRTAARKMHDLNIGSMLVVGNGTLLGIITDRDIGVFAIAMGHDPQSTEVQKVMTKSVLTCQEDQDIDDAIKIMEENNVRRLVVLNDQESVAGFLSVDNLAASTYSQAGAVLAAATLIH